VVGLFAGWLVDHSLLAEWEKLLRGLCGFGFGLALWKLWGLCGTRLGQFGSSAMTAAEVATLLLSGWIFVMAPQQPPILAADAVFGLTVLIFAAQRGAVSRLLFTAPFVLAGAISYSVYMVHGLVETAALRIVQMLLAVSGGPSLFATDTTTARPVPSGDWRADLIGAVALALVFAAAWLLFRWFEWPLREWSRQIAARSNWPLGTDCTTLYRRDHD
jgi:peptidoglycan/LPS O-acetylase OafA/YrhL